MMQSSFGRMSMDKVTGHANPDGPPWLWHGNLLPGEITLLTSMWKTGKTTLLAGLLRAMREGGQFLGQPLRKGRAMIVSEESVMHWADRQRTIPLGIHVSLIARPFRGKPTIDDWNKLLEEAFDVKVNEGLDLFVVDPLASFLTGRSESDAATLLAMLKPLHGLAMLGVAVLICITRASVILRSACRPGAAGH